MSSLFSSCKSKSNPKHKIDIRSNLPITLPYTFKTPKAEQLSVTAFNLKKEGDYDEAIAKYKEAIKIEPANPKLFFDLSECYSRSDKANEAIASLETAIILDDSCAVCYNNLGLIYWQLYKDQYALNNYQKAIQLDSNNWVYYSNMSLAYYSNRETSQACKAFNRAKLLGLDEKTVKADKHLKEVEQLCR